MTKSTSSSIMKGDALKGIKNDNPDVNINGNGIRMNDLESHSHGNHYQNENRSLFSDLRTGGSSLHIQDLYLQNDIAATTNAATTAAATTAATATGTLANTDWIMNQNQPSQEFYSTMHHVLTSANINTNQELYKRIMSSAIVDATASSDDDYFLSDDDDDDDVDDTDELVRYDDTNKQQRLTHYQSLYSNHYTNGFPKMIQQQRYFSSSSSSNNDKQVQTPTSPTSTSTNLGQATTPTTPKALKKETLSSSTPSTTLTNMADKFQTMSKSMMSSIASILAKIPGVLWFYLTHPTEFKEKLIEFKEIAKKEAHHYYMGSKLLMADVRTARQMLYRLLQGSSLTRRERKQLLRTVTDVFRLVPMSIFVLIPFMEIALPFALKVFPNMLPSTFQDSLKAEETMKKELKSRIAMAEFFQETLEDLAKGHRKTATKRKESIQANDGATTELNETESREERAASFLDFIEKARKGEFLPPEVIIRYASFFKDELTLDNMPRMQLVNMCKYMSIPPYGNNNILRFQLRHKIRMLVEDDQRILWEGIDSLTKMELREACQERGMRSTGLSKDAYKRSLQQWIDLSVNRHVPISLLIMSRTFFLREEMTSRGSVDTDGSKSVSGLADAISGLDREVVNEVILESVTSESKERDPALIKLKLDVLEHQNELIKEEQEQRQAEEEAKKAEKEAAAEKETVDKKDEKTQKLIGMDDKSVSNDEMKIVDEGMILEELSSSEKIAGASDEKVKSKSDSGTDLSTVDEKATEEKEREEEESTLSSEEMDAISHLVSPDPVSAERLKLEKIKAAMQQDKEEENLNEEEQNAKETVEEEIIDAPIDSISEQKVSADITESTSDITSAEEQDRKVAEQIAALDEDVRLEAESSTTISMHGDVDKSQVTEVVESHEEVEKDETEYKNDKLEMSIARLKSKVESMVGNIEIQLSDAEAKIGDRLHFLDKDLDGIVSREEMALCLQSVLKRPLTSDEAMAIAIDMDEDEDGLLSLEELSKWLETNKIMKLVEEGRDAEVDQLIASQAEKMKQENAVEEKKD